MRVCMRDRRRYWRTTLTGIEVVTPTDRLNIAEGSDLPEIADIVRN
jgi:hypothetical protein